MTYISNTFPTAIQTGTDPIGTDEMSTFDHAGLESFQNDSILALKNKVGIDSSAVNTSHDYKLSGVSTGDKAVSKTGTETLTNKTLTSPTINTPAISGGTVSGATISSPTFSSAISIANGGTNSTTANGAFNNLLPSQTGNANKVLVTDGSNTSWTASITPKFGGTGVDGALSITSGATNIDLAGAQVVTKNYTSISITGTGYLTFTNPHANGTIVVLKSQGNVTITTSATNAIDMRDLGGQTSSAYGNGLIISTNAGKTGTVSGGSGTPLGIHNAKSVSGKCINVYCGAGGGAGNFGAAGGKGAGGLYIECAGAWNVTGTINLSGSTGTGGGTGANQQTGGGSGGASWADGTAGTSTTSTALGAGGGGGGGVFIGLYNTLTANSGTYTVTGGASGGFYAGPGGDGYYYVGLNTEFV